MKLKVMDWPQLVVMKKTPGAKLNFCIRAVELLDVPLLPLVHVNNAPHLHMSQHLDFKGLSKIPDRHVGNLLRENLCIVIRTMMH